MSTTAAEAFSSGTSCFIDEDYDGALTELNKAIDLDTSKAEYFDKRAAVYLKLNRPTEALEDEVAALKLSPNKSQYLLRKGLALFELERFREANASLREAEAADKESPALSKKSKAQLATWLRKCEAELEDEDAGDRLPQEPPVDEQEVPEPEEVQPPPVAKIRHSYYQVS